MITAAAYFSPYALLAVSLGYVLVLGLVGHWAERRARAGHQVSNHGVIYTLALMIFCTSWTYFGSVGSATHSGMLYSAVYLGPTLVMLVGWVLIRRIILLRKHYRFTSVVDFVTQRYGQSVLMGGFITLVLLLGMIPYIGLQIRAILESFTILTGLQHTQESLSSGHYIDEAMVVIIGVMTCLYGLRRVDTQERQHGLMAILALEAVIKLLAFLVIGIFVVWGLFDGPTDLVSRVYQDTLLKAHLVDAALPGQAYINWMTYLILSMAALIFLPHMFHVMVIENYRVEHLRTAMWGFPLYLLLISLFVLPIAIGGMLLGYPLVSADWLVIKLPFDDGQNALALLSYLGGFSAATGMVIVACTTMSTMFSNHIVLPRLAASFPHTDFSGFIRPIRWGSVFSLLGLAYGFEQGLSNSYLLIQMGMISFAAMLQFVPAGLGGLFWRRGNASGAWWGLGLGWAVWFYTLFLPAMVRSMQRDISWLTNGPWGIKFLRPELLVGLDLGSPYANAVFWSMALNLTGYVFGSLISNVVEDEVTHRYAGKDTLDSVSDSLSTTSKLDISPNDVKAQIHQLLHRYLDPIVAEAAVAAIDFSDLDKKMTSVRYLDLVSQVELALAGVVGAALARKAVGEGLRLSERDTVVLQGAWAAQLANLRVSPQQLREQVDYLRRLHEVSDAHAREMSEHIRALENAAAARFRAESALRETNQNLEQLVTERTRALQDTVSSLRESEAFIRSITDSAQEAVVMMDAAGQVAFWNPAAEKIFGWSADEALGRPLHEFLIPEGPLRDRHCAAQVGFQQGTSVGVIGQTIELPACRKDGHQIPVELSLSSTLLNGKRHAIGMLRDITEKKRAAVALQEAKQWSESIVQLAPSMVIGLTPNGRIVLFNDHAEQVTGYSRDEVLGRDWTTLFIPIDEQVEIRTIIDEAVQTGDVLRFNENSIVVRDGSRCIVSWSSQVMKQGGQVKMILSFGVDVTTRRQAEQELQQKYAELKTLNEKLEETQNQLLQSEKMASIGQLAAGVAHEINNPVGFVNSNLGTLNKYCTDMLGLIETYRAVEGNIQDTEALEKISALKNALDIDFLAEDLPALLKESTDGLVRVKKIVQDLKDFSHVGESEWQLADIHAGLDSTLNVIWNEVKYKAKVEKRYGTLPQIQCLAAQINQVFMNLMVNAAHAMDKSKGLGLLTITTGVEGEYVWIDIEDTGDGMTEEVQRRIFEPFFTTKPIGKGTGLGLSVSYNIVKKHRGRIEVHSKVGEGTRFRVWIPISSSENET